MDSKTCSMPNCNNEATIMCNDCQDRDSEGKLEECRLYCKSHDNTVHEFFPNHNKEAIRNVAHNEDVLAFHDREIRHLRKLECLKAEIDLMTSDLKIQKEINTRHIKLVVAELQQAILNRGKALAKQVSATYDTKMTELSDVKLDVDKCVNLVLKKITELDKLKNLSGDEFSEEYLRLKKEGTFEKSAYDLHVPKNCPLLSLDKGPLHNALNDLEIVEIESQVSDKCELPVFEFKEGKKLDMVCTDLWWANKTCFPLLPAADSIPAALENLSAHVRRRFIEDGDWQCFKDIGQEPEVGSRVFTRLASSSKQWCRAQVVSNFAMRKQSEVFLIDWGQTLQDVSWSDMLPYKEEMTAQEPVAIECVIEEDIDPAVARDAKWSFNDYMQKFSSSCIPLQVTLNKQVKVGEKMVWKVDICGTQPDGAVVDISQIVRSKLEDRISKKSTIHCHDIRKEFHADSEPVNAVSDPPVQPEQSSNAAERDESEDSSTRDAVTDTSLVITQYANTGAVTTHEGAKRGGPVAKRPVPSMVPKCVSVSYPVVKSFTANGVADTDATTTASFDAVQVETGEVQGICAKGDSAVNTMTSGDESRFMNTQGNSTVTHRAAGKGVDECKNDKSSADRPNGEPSGVKPADDIVVSTGAVQREEGTRCPPELRAMQTDVALPETAEADVIVESETVENQSAV